MGIHLLSGLHTQNGLVILFIGLMGLQVLIVLGTAMRIANSSWVRQTRSAKDSCSMCCARLMEKEPNISHILWLTQMRCPGYMWIHSSFMRLSPRQFMRGACQVMEQRSRISLPELTMAMGGW